MRIAVLLYGQLRFFPLNIELFKQNFLPAFNNHSVQYFAHFWNDQQLDELKQTYNPMEVKIEQQGSIDDTKTYLGCTTNKVSDNLPRQLQSLFGSFSLLKDYQIKHNTNFDLYIKIRTDLAYLSKIEIDSLENNCLYVPTIKDRHLSEYVQDLVLMTKNYEYMQNICTMGFALNHMARRLGQKENRDLFYHEEILAEYIKYKGMNIKMHNFTVDLARHIQK